MAVPFHITGTEEETEGAFLEKTLNCNELNYQLN